jgi:hypothetical protein
MLIVTTIYCAETEHVDQPGTKKAAEKTLADLKDGERKLMSMYQGTNRALPLDGER